jgi:N-acetylmuramoyl-L-alanine amidase
MSNRTPGKYDPGAVGGGLQEADIALQWALTGKWMCQQAGIPVYLTRDDDSDHNPVGVRDEKAEINYCTHFISLHCNAGGGTGIETFYRDAEDKAFASEIQSAVLRATGGTNRGIKHESQTQHDRLAVMDFNGPCALLELGFIDNETDRRWLTRRESRIQFWSLLIGALKGQ